MGIDWKSDRGDIETGGGHGFLAIVSVTVASVLLVTMAGKCSAPDRSPNTAPSAQLLPDCSGSDVPCVTRWDDGSWHMVTIGSARQPLTFSAVTYMSTATASDGSAWHWVRLSS